MLELIHDAPVWKFCLELMIESLLVIIETQLIGAGHELHSHKTSAYAAFDAWSGDYFPLNPSNEVLDASSRLARFLSERS